MIKIHVKYLTITFKYLFYRHEYKISPNIYINTQLPKENCWNWEKNLIKVNANIENFFAFWLNEETNEVKKETYRGFVNGK